MCRKRWEADASGGRRLAAATSMSKSPCRGRRVASSRRSALSWFMRNAEGDQALRLTVPLAYFWTAEGRQKESRELLTKVIALPSAAAPTALRAKALYDVGLLSFRQRDQAASRAQNEESLQ